MKYLITGDNMQALQMTLVKGEEVFAEAGTMLYKRGHIEMDSKAMGGVLKSLTRKLFTGESLFMSTFRCDGDVAEIAFASPNPGKIKSIEFKGQEIICAKDSFLCSIGDIDVSVTFTKRLRVGIFGGQGFILQKISGNGLVFIHGGGNFVEIDLIENEEIEVDSGCIVMMDSSVDYDIRFVGGIKKALFGGEGLFLAKLTGPGKIVLQTLPFARLASELGKKFTRSGGSIGSGSFGSIFGQN